MSRIKFTLFMIMSFLVLQSFAQTTWKPREGHIMSKWVEDIDLKSVLNEYPRPQMVRRDWLNLNGLWKYAIVDNDVSRPEKFDGDILVPFAVESALSGVKKRIDDKQQLWYKRTFAVPDNWKGKKVMLNFGAVDWETSVYVNGILVGNHQGGYDPFNFDITHALQSTDNQEIIVSVWDPTTEGSQSVGKQATKPNGIWYTPVSGIWQTVWLEPVSNAYIDDIKATPNVDSNALTVLVESKGHSEKDYRIQIVAKENGNEVSRGVGQTGKEISLAIASPKLWSPDNPFLYDLEVTLLKKTKVVDKIESYFAMRKISLDKTSDGHERLFLNNKPLFQYGTLDQGWWPGGLYTAPTDEALKYDIQTTKDCGFNMIRKHVKVESARWYYHCDKLGMLVWQDMPNGDKNADWRGPSGYDGREMVRDAQSARQYRKEWKSIMDAKYHFPSIVMWVPFNEGWGQFDTVDIIEWTMDYDPSRLVNGPSGGNFFPVGHTVDEHRYPGPGLPEEEIHAPNIMKDRALVLGEFGGLGLPVKEHLWQSDKNWGYRNYGDKQELIENYKKLLDKIPALIKKGLAAAIYTQTTDVEGEVNGIMTYDRSILKMNADEMSKYSEQLYETIK